MNAPITKTHYKDLETKGFVVIPSFLSPTEVEALLEDFNRQGVADNKNCNMVLPTEEAVDGLREKLENCSLRVQEETDIKVDASAVHVGVYFATELVTVGWHQDHESYYELQNHIDYLNFFIPIQKPKRDKGNLSVVPWDAIKKSCPEQYAALVGGGGRTLRVIGNKTLVTDDRGVVTVLPIDIDTIGVTPELDGGDLLLVRGDTIHRTQDAETKRIAFSLRITNPDNVIDRKKLVSGGLRKSRMMIRNWSEFGPLVKAFQSENKSTLTWREMNLLKGKRSGDGQDSTVRATMFLIGQKLVTGTLLRSVGYAVSGMYSRMYASMMRMAAKSKSSERSAEVTGN